MIVIVDVYEILKVEEVFILVLIVVIVIVVRSIVKVNVMKNEF